MELEKYLKIGFIQTVVNKDMAWLGYPNSLNMKEISEKKVWQEIKNGFCNLKDYGNRPDLIVLPELTLPHGYVNEVRRLSKAMGSVVIAGLDFEKVHLNRIRNRAVIVIPENWQEEKKSLRTSSVYFGKTFFSDVEIEFFNTFSCKPLPDPNTYIFNAGKFGNIGLAICSDFFDIERFAIYRGQIHHMIIISYNPDVESYYFLAEAISRLVYCNVVICNTGYYGDSLAFSPYKETYERIVYRHRGQRLFTTQVVQLPVASLDAAQRKSSPGKRFKPAPPGYRRA